MVGSVRRRSPLAWVEMVSNCCLKLAACGTLPARQSTPALARRSLTMRYTGKRLTCEVLGGSGEPPRNR